MCVNTQRFQHGSDTSSVQPGKFLWFGILDLELLISLQNVSIVVTYLPLKSKGRETIISQNEFVIFCARLTKTTKNKHRSNT